jgi:hypothetical protein
LVSLLGSWLGGLGGLRRFGGMTGFLTVRSMLLWRGPMRCWR